MMVQVGIPILKHRYRITMPFLINIFWHVKWESLNCSDALSSHCINLLIMSRKVPNEKIICKSQPILLKTQIGQISVNGWLLCFVHLHNLVPMGMVVLFSGCPPTYLYPSWLAFPPPQATEVIQSTVLLFLKHNILSWIHLNLRQDTIHKETSLIYHKESIMRFNLQLCSAHFSL